MIFTNSSEISCQFLTNFNFWNFWEWIHVIFIKIFVFTSKKAFEWGIKRYNWFCWENFGWWMHGHPKIFNQTNSSTFTWFAYLALVNFQRNSSAIPGGQFHTKNVIWSGLNNTKFHSRFFRHSIISFVFVSPFMCLLGRCALVTSLTSAQIQNRYN